MSFAAEIPLRRGAGAYICGEESAMIESIEGKRGMPRLRPPYVAQVGLFGHPTLEHNMETLYWVREILQKGAGGLPSTAGNGRKGCVRSRCRAREETRRASRAGRHHGEGADRRILRRHAAGARVLRLSPGGASGGILPASLDGRHSARFRHAAAPTAASSARRPIIVLSDQDKARDAARNVMKFFADESCGQCTPCRVGTPRHCS
jgi:formate dehydrogenase beta subunit